MTPAGVDMRLGIRELIFLMLMVGLVTCSYLFVFKPNQERRATLDGGTAVKRQVTAHAARRRSEASTVAKLSGKSSACRVNRSPSCGLSSPCSRCTPVESSYITNVWEV